MLNPSAIPVAVLALAVGVAAEAYDREPIPASEQQAWGRRVVPLPRQIRVTGTVTLPASDVRIRLPAGAGDLVEAAVDELATLFRENSGAPVPIAAGAADPASFTLDFRGGDPDRLIPADCRHRTQAYALRPVSDGRGVSGLTLSYGGDEGAYYAVQTLRLLLRQAFARRRETPVVTVPIVEVTDWPDLDERGEWGGSAVADLEWMASRKFNLVELHAKLTVDPDGTGHAAMPPEVMARARRCGVRIVPIIHHLEQLQGTGMFKVFPQLKATAVPDAICFARPEIGRLLTQWFSDLGRLPRITDVMVWLSEEGKGCACEVCKQNDRFVNEVRVCIAAWQAAKPACPQLGLRLLLTQASYPSNENILAAVPAGVKVSYYHGGLTYDTTRRPMIYPLLEAYAKQGRWLGVYPTLGASWLSVAPFTNPAFVHQRLTEFVDKGLICLVAYVVPGNDYYRANVEAAMDWAWNAHGRTPQEFAVAYATRQGVPEPETFAQWADTLGPVSWDVCGSGFPYREHWGGTDKIAQGPAKLGESIFFEYKREAQFDEDLARCDQALALAEKIGRPAVLVETRIVQGYARMLRAVWGLTKVLQGAQMADPANRDTALRWFDLFQQGSSAVMTLYPEWGETVAPDDAAQGTSRFGDTLTTVERLDGRMGALREACGFTDPDKPYRLQVLGTWTTAEFASEPGQTRRFDVAGVVTTPGRYVFRPKYKKGTLGLAASRVALVSFPKDKPADVRVEVEDRHPCHAGAWVKGDVYTLEVKQVDPARGYVVQADIHGGDSTEGEFLFRKLRPGE